MNRKSLILTIMLTLMIFLSASVVSAADDTDFTLTADETTHAEVTVNTTDTNDQIQAKINSLNDGDTLNFEKGDYNNISLYVDKSITINGNGATLHGYDNLVEGDSRLPDKILNQTTQGGYGITRSATFYIIQTNGVVLKDIKIVAGANSGTDKVDNKYTNCVIYCEKAAKTQIINTTVDGCTWGIWIFQCADNIIENSKVMNQGITGILSFQSPRSIIRNNTVTNAKNHGIDVRHQAGNNATVIDNIVKGSKEGIYLLHSGGHKVTGNEIIGCSLSSITCCGAKNVLIENNKLKKSRIGVLLGGSTPTQAGATYTAYENITIGANEWTFDKLPMPPSFEFYVAEAKGDYASLDTMIGTYTDSTLSDITFVEYTEIETPKEVVVDYDALLKVTGNNVTISSGMNNAQIQSAIDGMSNGDTLIFEENAVFEDICLLINKNIKIIGNNATLKGLNTANKTVILNSGLPDTYNAKGYAAILYSVNNSGVVISDLNIVSKYPNYSNPNDAEYKTACIFAENSAKLTVTGCSLDGASWGLIAGFQKNGCPNSIITNNKVSNQYTTGILCFGSKFSVIINNTVTDAKNHGIDVRFNNTGFNVTVFNNTVSGAKEGIYLLHSYGHKVYNNTVLNSKISSITCYGSGNEYIFNNKLSGSRIAILLGGGYYNVHIGKNTYIPDKLQKLPPTFEYYVVKGDAKYNQDKTTVMRTYSDKETVTISAPEVTLDYLKTGELKITLIDQNNKVMSEKTIAVNFNGNYTLKTDENGSAVIPIAGLAAGTYNATISYAGNDNYAPAKVNTSVVINPAASYIISSGKTVYLQAIAGGYKYSVTLADSEGNALANRTVTITFNNLDYNATTDENGVATVTLKVKKIGSYNAEIKFAGEDNYKAKTKTKTITVIQEPSKIIASKAIFKAKTKNKYYTIKLKTKSGAPIANAKVTLKVKGVTYKAYTNSYGKAKFKINKLTKKGKFTAKIKFNGKVLYAGQIAYVTIKNY